MVFIGEAFNSRVVARTRAAEKRCGQFHSGSGMNSVSLGTCAKRPLFQSCLACSIRSLLEETKFHQMWRGAPPGHSPRKTNLPGTVGRAMKHWPCRNETSVLPSLQ